MTRATLEYRVAGRPVCLPRDETLVGLTFSDRLPSDQRRVIERLSVDGADYRRYEVPGHRLTVMKLEDPLPSGEVAPLAVPNRLAGLGEVEKTQPLHIFNGLRVAVSDRLVVKVRDPDVDVAARLADWGVEILERRGATVVGRAPADVDGVALAARLDREDWVAYAEPDLISIGSHPRRGEATISAFSVTGPPGLQPALRQIRAEQAWQAVEASPEIRIAVLDDGADLRHAAFGSAVAGLYDALSGADEIATNPWDTHGTACGGLAAGRDDAQGFRGVAAGCRLLVARIASSPAPGQPWATANSTISRGIAWAVDQGADVLSNSWGGGAPSNMVIDALAEARSRGRSGKGCVLVFAAGNSAGDVVYPGNLSGVLTVSGVNLEDRFKTRSSADNEYWWGSCYGPAVDLAAPAVRLFTADTLGPPGKSQGDYYDGFNGTSGATPLVAGAAALLLSRRPDLPEAEVRRLLCESADKVGELPYADGRNDQLGWGRLNVEAALSLLAGQAPPADDEPEDDEPVDDGPGEDGPDDDEGQAGPGGQVTGIVRRALANLPVFYLKPPDSPSALLQSAPAEAAVTPGRLLADNIAAFAALEGQETTIAFDTRQETAPGIVLWGARVAGGAGDGADGPGGGPDGGPAPSPSGDADEPADDEVLLPRPEDDVFAALDAGRSRRPRRKTIR